MEKVFLKPSVKEIVVKGASKEGPVDLFSYDYDSDDSKKRLGHLYVVGNIQAGASPEGEEDTAYVTNLIASLAKREYYVQPDLSPKDAFSAALKKINGVVEEFFKHKDTKLNVGIFAVAGNEIHISKLGKFKILLSRDGKVIDILNNLQLFSKESSGEKEFSNIVSGAIHDGDRLLALYPSRVITTRDKSLKESFTHSTSEELSAKLASIKDTKKDFACAALHIEINKASEAADEKRVQPKELIEEPIELPVVKLTEAEESDNEDKESIAVPVVPEVVSKSQPLSEVTEFPKIRPSEFALGKKDLPFAKHFRRFKKMNITPQNKMVLAGIAVVVIAGGGFVLKTYAFVSPAQKALNQAVSQAKSDLKLAQTKISQQDLTGAHSILLGALAAVSDSETKNGSSSSADSAKSDITKALDGLDQATDATLTMVGDLSSNGGTAQLVLANGSNLYAYLDQSGSGSLVKVASGSTDFVAKLSNITPASIFGSSDYIVLANPADEQLTSVSVSKSSQSSVKFSADGLTSLYIFNDNLYGLTSSGVIKIADAASGHTSVSSWLSSGTQLPQDATLIAVDGNVYVLGTDGTLTTYYKGQKTNSVSTPIAAGDSMVLLTSENSQNLFVVDRNLGRIYILKKDSGTLVKTLKVNSNSPIQSATVDSSDNIYILSGNKIWQAK